MAEQNLIVFIGILKSSIQQCKIYSLWHPVKSHQACKKAGKYDAYPREKLTNTKRHSNERELN